MGVGLRAVLRLAIDRGRVGDMSARVRFAFGLLVLAGCGIKGPPRAPLDEPPPAVAVPNPLVAEPDAGCCQVHPR